MKNNNQTFMVSRESYGSTTATYNGIELVAINKFDIGSRLNFNWGDTSPGSEALSYAILKKVGSSDIANKYANSYTKHVISKIKKDEWTLNASAVIQWINENTNYSIDESAYFKNGSITYEYEDRRQEERRKEERRIQREKDFQEEAKRRLELRKEERRVEDRRLSKEQNFEEKDQKSSQEIQAQHQQELDNYKKQIIEQNTKIKAYQEQLEKYKYFVESLNIKSMYDKYCTLDD